MNRLLVNLFFAAAMLGFAAPGAKSQTQIRYLSGTGKDDAVSWDLFLAGGSETVKTVHRFDSLNLDHRAEAMVLIRSLRVPRSQIRSQPYIDLSTKLPPPHSQRVIECLTKQVYKDTAPSSGLPSTRTDSVSTRFSS